LSTLTTYSLENRFIRLIGNKHCMVIFDDGKYLNITIASIDQLAPAISHGIVTKQLNLERLEGQLCFTVDEMKRLFGIISVRKVCLFPIFS
jgi:hypothetical protein